MIGRARVLLYADGFSSPADGRDSNPRRGCARCTRPRRCGVQRPRAGTTCRVWQYRGHSPSSRPARGTRRRLAACSRGGTSLPADPESDSWRAQLAELQRLATAWTGNDTRVLEFGEGEVSGSEARSVLEDALHEGIELLGSRRTLQRLISAKVRHVVDEPGHVRA